MKLPFILLFVLAAGSAEAQEYPFDPNRCVVGLTSLFPRQTQIGPVEPGSPAAAAGLHMMDEIIAINGRSAADVRNLAEMKQRIGSGPGSVKLTVRVKETSAIKTVVLKRIPLGQLPRVKNNPKNLTHILF